MPLTARGRLSDPGLAQQMLQAGLGSQWPAVRVIEERSARRARERQERELARQAAKNQTAEHVAWMR